MTNGAQAIIQRILWGIAAIVFTAVVGALLSVIGWMLLTINDFEKWRVETNAEAAAFSDIRWTVIEQAKFVEKLDSRLDGIETDVVVIRQLIESTHQHHPP